MSPSRYIGLLAWKAGQGSQRGGHLGIPAERGTLGYCALEEDYRLPLSSFSKKSKKCLMEKWGQVLEIMRKTSLPRHTHI